MSKKSSINIKDYRGDIIHYNYPVPMRFMQRYLTVELCRVLNEELTAMDIVVLTMCELESDNWNVVGGHYLKGLGIKDDTLRRCINRLVKSRVVLRLAGGGVKLNPEYYWRGDQESREEEMRDTIAWLKTTKNYLTDIYIEKQRKK